MMVVIVMAAAIWGIGAVMGTPRRMRAMALGGLWLAVVLAHLVLPADHPLRLATGGDARGWLVLAGLVAVVMAYRAGLSRLRARAAPPAPAPVARGPGAPFHGDELTRYARHILLREIGGPGQRQIKDAKVLVVGAGGLGSASILYLAAGGVGVIGVIDGDVVEASNLQRQIIHTEARLGLPKVFSAAEAVAALNPHVVFRPYHRRLDDTNAAQLIADYDLVLDGCDNFDTRYLINRTCVALGKPLISAAMTPWEGQVSLYDPARGGPCYECVFPTRPAPGTVPSCAEAGVVAPLPGIIGSMMALEAVKEITGAGQGLRGRLLLHDALGGESRMIRTKPRPGCPVCGHLNPGP